MSIIVKKFGGSSIKDIHRIKEVARRIVKEYKKGDQIVIVVSAMGDTTDELHSLAHRITPFPSEREMDMLLTAGERISMSLLSMALNNFGFRAISFTGSQSGIITTDDHCNARIKDIRAFRIKQELDRGKIVIVAGFQGVSENKEVTTLGRGGSDTTAVALACYLNADLCQIFTDVDGVFNADPGIVKNAKKFDKIDFQEMLIMAHLGAKLIHPRAVEFAKKHQIPVTICSSFNNNPGTLIYGNDKMEEIKFKAITDKENLAVIKFSAQQEKLKHIIELANQNNLTFEHWGQSNDSINIIANEKIAERIHLLLQDFDIKEITLEKGLARIALIGKSFSQDFSIISKLYKVFTKNHINIKMLASENIAILIYVDKKDKEKTIELLYDNFVEQCESG